MGYNDSGAGFCRAILLILNVFFLLLGLAVSAGGIYMFVTEIEVRQIIGTELYEASVFVIFGSGVSTVIMTLIGIIGAARRNKILLIIYFVVLMIIFVMMAIGGVLAAVFQANIQRTMKEKMTDTLVKDYGRRRLVTQAWDWIQTTLKCCAVNNEGWETYKTSGWYKDQQTHLAIDHKYVPTSCCTRNQKDKIINQPACQFYTTNKPNKEFVYYNGCYDEGYNFIVERAWIIFGIGLGVAFCLVLGLIVSVCVFRTLD